MFFRIFRFYRFSRLFLHLMGYGIAGCTILMSLILLIRIPVSAHFLQTDKNIGAVLHISPDDDPIIGSPASFYFDIKDKEGKFKSVNCVCEFTVLENGIQIQNNKASAGGESAEVASFTFPKADLYTVQVQGKPDDGSFSEFSLTWDIRVTRVAESSSSSWTNKIRDDLSIHFAHYIIFGGGFVFFLGFIIWDERRKNRLR